MEEKYVEDFKAGDTVKLNVDYAIIVSPGHLDKKHREAFIENQDKRYSVITVNKDSNFPIIINDEVKNLGSGFKREELVKVNE